MFLSIPFEYSPIQKAFNQTINKLAFLFLLNFWRIWKIKVKKMYPFNVGEIIFKPSHSYDVFMMEFYILNVPSFGP